MNKCSSYYYCSYGQALKLRYNELATQLTTGLVRALSDSVDSKAAKLTVKRSLHVS